MHYLFEQILGSAEDIQALHLYADDLKARVHTSIMDYVRENMGGYDALSPREKYRLYRMEQTAVKLIAHMSEEMMHSLFRPEHFELELKTAHRTHRCASQRKRARHGRRNHRPCGFV